MFYQGGNGIMSYIKDGNIRKTEEYPSAYIEYLEAEKKWVQNEIGHVHSLLDAGCGDGRLSLFLAGFTKKYVGVDLDTEALKKARQFESDTIRFVHGDLASLGNLFDENSFNATASLWNTLGNIEEDERALKEMYLVSRDKVLISVIEKGHIPERIDYYRTMNVPFELDEDKEIIYSEAWGIARAYSRKELADLSTQIGFRVKNIVSLGKIAFGIVLVKHNNPFFLSPSW